MELIAQHAHPGQRSMSDAAFTVGIMSLMDALFSIPMTEILKQLPVVDEVIDALLRRQGNYGELLRLAEHLEHIEEAGSALNALVEKYQLSAEDLYEIQLDAFAWSDNVARNAA